MSVVVRMAPSPTGNLHVGTARVALFNYLFARQKGGRYLLRSEDTDRARSKSEFEAEIIEHLEWLGLNWDEFSRQSDQTEKYTAYLQQLVASDKAYLSKEPKKDSPDEEVEVVRLRNSGTVVTFHDLIRGDVTFDTTELGDVVIARALDDPLYHFTVVVDDHEGGVTHVIRGEDHISNTPRQILIQEALGFSRPEYAHLPLLLAPDRSKLSKRKGVTAVKTYREEGYLPEALVNYLALLGWSPGTDQELFTLDELVENFQIEQVSKGGAIFSREKLNWFNKHYLEQLPETEKANYLFNNLTDEALKSTLTRSPAALADVFDRIHTRAEFIEAVERGDYDFYRETPHYEKEALLWKKNPDPIRTKDLLERALKMLDNVEATMWTREHLYNAVWPLAESEGKGDVLWPLRYALSGKEKSPDPFTLLEACGKEEARARITHAVSLLS